LQSGDNLVAPKSGALLISNLLGALALLPTLALAESDEARDWVMRMDRAVEFTNYEGRMVYMRRDHIGTYQIYHRVNGEEVEERLVRMDGEGAEIIRRKNEVICIFPKQRSVVVEKRARRDRKQNPLAASVPGYAPSMQQSYRLVLSGTARIAGRETVRVRIAPKDGYRYGYKLWLDKKTAMPLKSQLIDSSRDMPIEEMLFTSIALGKEIAAESLQSSMETEKFNWVRASDSRIHGRSAAAAITWKATDLPPGFMMSEAHLEYSSANANPRMHLVYTDSIASVSVFVDEGVAASEQVEGLSAMGAANAYSVMHEGWLITAMGEVPAATVQRIAVSVRQEDVR
jgi:sigma-E factor negative regulatory protein RseB